MSKLSDAAVEVAKTQVGQKENPLGSNWGEPVQTYLKSVGITFPASWCMGFVYWCFNEASKKIGQSNSAVKTGGVLAAWNKALPQQKGMPQIGSVIIFDHGGGLGHTGIIEKMDEKYFYTIEGNTNNNGSREGIAVERKKRIRTDKTIKGFLNY